MTGIPKVLYGIATEYWLTEIGPLRNEQAIVLYNYLIDGAEKNANKIKEKYSKYGMIGIANTIKVVEYKLVEDEVINND